VVINGFSQKPFNNKILFANEDAQRFYAGLKIKKPAL